MARAGPPARTLPSDPRRGRRSPFARSHARAGHAPERPARLRARRGSRTRRAPALPLGPQDLTARLIGPSSSFTDQASVARARRRCAVPWRFPCVLTELICAGNRSLRCSLFGPPPSDRPRPRRHLRAPDPARCIAVHRPGPMPRRRGISPPATPTSPPADARRRPPRRPPPNRGLNPSSYGRSSGADVPASSGTGRFRSRAATSSRAPTSIELSTAKISPAPTSPASRAG